MNHKEFSNIRNIFPKSLCSQHGRWYLECLHRSFPMKQKEEQKELLEYIFAKYEDSDNLKDLFINLSPYYRDKKAICLEA